MDMTAVVLPPELRRTIPWVHTTKHSPQLHLSDIRFITLTLAQHSSLNEDMELSDVVMAAVLKEVCSRLIVTGSANDGDSSESDHNDVGEEHVIIQISCWLVMCTATTEHIECDVWLCNCIEGEMGSTMQVLSLTADTDSMLTWATNDNQDSRVDLNHQDKEEPGLWLQHNIEPQYEVHQQQEPDVSPAQEQHDLSTTRSYSNTLDPTVQQPRETEPADPYETHDSVANTSAAIDPPCSDTAATTTKAQLLGILVKVLTGDTVTITKGTCKMLALGTKVYNSHHPIEMLQHHGHLTAMTGDSVNDASSLKKIECGTTIKGASDTTRSSADVVSLNKGISTIITLIKKLTKRQSMHDNNLPTSKNRDTFLKLIHGHSKKHRMGTQVALQFHGGVVESRNLQDIDKVSELMIDFTHTELCSTQMHWFNRCIPHTIIILDEVICSNLLEAYAKEVVCDLPKGQ